VQASVAADQNAVATGSLASVAPAAGSLSSQSSDETALATQVSSYTGQPDGTPYLNYTPADPSPDAWPYLNYTPAGPAPSADALNYTPADLNYTPADAAVSGETLNYTPAGPELSSQPLPYTPADAGQSAEPLNYTPANAASNAEPFSFTPASEADDASTSGTLTPLTDAQIQDLLISVGLADDAQGDIAGGTPGPTDDPSDPVTLDDPDAGSVHVTELTFSDEEAEVITPNATVMALLQSISDYLQNSFGGLLPSPEQMQREMEPGIYSDGSWPSSSDDDSDDEAVEDQWHELIDELAHHDEGPEPPEGPTPIFPIGPTGEWNRDWVPTGSDAPYWIEQDWEAE
jgi:hypothetical protein